MLWNSGPSYEYDAFNRMRRFRGGVAPGSEEWVFAYTADDERVFSARVGGGGTVWSLRGLDNQLLREWRAEDGKHSFRDYVWTGRNLLAKIERTPAAGSPGWSEATRHAAVDHLGSVRLWTDAGGANLPGFIYYPFGKQLNGTVDDEQMRFTGHERDLWNTTSSNDDLDYMHARHYNPQLGRFLQIDPLAGSVSAPQSLNRYAYVLGNPLSFTDPEGLSADANATGCPMPYIWITDHWGCNQGGGGGGISRSLLLWFISRWFNNPGTGGDGDFPWGGGGRPGTPTGSPTNPTDPGNGPEDKPKDKPKKDKDDDPCIGAPLQVQLSIPLVPIPPLLGLFGGIDISFTQFRDGSSTLYLGGGFIGGGSVRNVSSSFGLGDGKYDTATEAPRGLGLYASAGVFSPFLVGFSGSIFGNGEATMESAGFGLGAGLSGSITAGYNGQWTEVHSSCE